MNFSGRLSWRRPTSAVLAAWPPPLSPGAFSLTSGSVPWHRLHLLPTKNNYKDMNFDEGGGGDIIIISVR